MTKREKAMAFHKEGYNCAQSVLLAFADDIGLGFTEAAKLTLPFGSGMGVKNTCGALTGALMVLGLVSDAATPPTPAEKANTYQQARALTALFANANGSDQCRDLLAQIAENKDAKSCNELVGYAAEMLEQFLNNEQ